MFLGETTYEAFLMLPRPLHQIRRDADIWRTVTAACQYVYVKCVAHLETTPLGPRVRGDDKLCTSRRSDDPLPRLRHVVRSDDRQSGLGEDFLAQLLVGTLHPHDERNLELDFARRGDDPGGDGVAFHDAAENVDQYRLQTRFAQHDLECFGHLFC